MVKKLGQANTWFISNCFIPLTSQVQGRAAARCSNFQGTGLVQFYSLRSNGRKHSIQEINQKLGATLSYSFQYIQLRDLTEHNIFHSLTQFKFFLLSIQTIRKYFPKLYCLLKSSVVTPVRNQYEWVWNLTDELTTQKWGWLIFL